MTDLEQEFLKIISELRIEVAALTEIILESQGLLIKEQVSSPTAGPVGKMPWYIRQQKLTKLFRAPKEGEDASQVG